MYAAGLHTVVAAPPRSLPNEYCELAALQGALQLPLLPALPVIPFIYTLSCKQINMPIAWDTWLSLYLRLAIRVCALDIDFYCLSYHSTKGHLIAVSFSLGGGGNNFYQPSDWWQSAQCHLLEAPFPWEVHCHTSELGLRLHSLTTPETWNESAKMHMPATHLRGETLKINEVWRKLLERKRKKKKS